MKPETAEVVKFLATVAALVGLVVLLAMVLVEQKKGSVCRAVCAPYAVEECSSRTAVCSQADGGVEARLVTEKR